MPVPRLIVTRISGACFHVATGSPDAAMATMIIVSNRGITTASSHGPQQHSPPNQTPKLIGSSPAALSRIACFIEFPQQLQGHSASPAGGRQGALEERFLPLLHGGRAAEVSHRFGKPGAAA